MPEYKNESLGVFAMCVFSGQCTC